MKIVPKISLHVLSGIEHFSSQQRMIYMSGNIRSSVRNYIIIQKTNQEAFSTVICEGPALLSGLDLFARLHEELALVEELDMMPPTQLFESYCSKLILLFLSVRLRGLALLIAFTWKCPALLGKILGTQ